MAFNKGHIQSENTRKKISDARKGMKFSEEHRMNISESHKGRVSPMFGKNHSLESKRKMSESQKGKKHICNKVYSVEERKRMSEAQKKVVNHKGRFKKGHSFSLEIRQKISMANKGKSSCWKGKTLSEEHRKKISEGGIGKHDCSPEMRKHLSEVNKGQVPWMKGKKHSEESKRKCSESNIGKHNFSDESRKKISEHRLGMKFSEEHRKNISRVTKGRVSNNKGKKMSDAQKLKISISGKGKHNFKMNEEGRKKISLARLNRSFPVKDSKPERIVQGWLSDLGVEFVKHKVMMIEHRYQCDIFIPSKNLVIECDGDYWHGNLEHRSLGKYTYDTLPESVKKQMENDRLRIKELIGAGFKVLRLWEHEIKSMSLEEFKNKYGE